MWLITPRRKHIFFTGGIKKKERAKWDNSIEFLMSCIATSVGLGNVWRFPFIAYQNGGGAFLIPYIVVLVIMGKPVYYLETFLGQFSSLNSNEVWAMCPAMLGAGYTQALGASYVLSYYVSIIGMCIYYLILSFHSTLPWSVCQPEWANCVPSGEAAKAGDQGKAVSSAELYFTHTVLRQPDSIHDGIGLPLWDHMLCLFAAWFFIYLVVAKGVKSTGRASYFLAVFPYLIMFILLIRAVTLPGAGKGIKFFITPDWSKILELKVWYAAVTQVIFSLSVCSGSLVMFASYNHFTQNVYRDSMIVTTLDTFTSLISGITIFGILGNLAHQLGYEDVIDVIGSGGTGLAFISYPDAIAQTPFMPQLFAVLFFVMMAVLGVGSAVALLATVNAIFQDKFPKIPTMYITAGTCFVGFLVGLVYVTPGGQYILELVDYYGGTFVRLLGGIIEIIGVFWIYGLENFCLDIKFTLGRSTSCFWRVCWSIVNPILMITVLIYALITTKQLLFRGTYEYPAVAYYAGDALQYSGIVFVVVPMVAAMWKYKADTCAKTVKKAFSQTDAYGPEDEQRKYEWKEFRAKAKLEHDLQRKSLIHHLLLSLFGGYKHTK